MTLLRGWRGEAVVRKGGELQVLADGTRTVDITFLLT
jgi:hypothetical protein